MKRTKLFTALILAMGLTFAAGNAIAQRGQGRMMDKDFERGPRMGQFIPNLTPEQESLIQETRTKHLKEVTPLRNELGEKRAKLRTLQSADKPDLKEINKLIDEMAALRATIQKKGAAHRAGVSSILTDEQRVHFNARKAGKMGKRGVGPLGRGAGVCPYMQ